MSESRRKNVPPLGAALILFGLIVPLAVFFGALWQNHPDPSNFEPGELFSLRLNFTDDAFVYECPESGEVFSLDKIPHERIGVRPSDRQAYESFVEQNIRLKEGAGVRFVYILFAGVIMLAAGFFLSARNRGA